MPSTGVVEKTKPIWQEIDVMFHVVAYLKVVGRPDTFEGYISIVVYQDVFDYIGLISVLLGNSIQISCDVMRIGITDMNSDVSCKH